MANIGSLITNIRNAVFGVQVRDSIADGIEGINNEVESTTSRQTALEDSMNTLADNLDDAESVRISSENTRVSNEQSRSTAESTRVSEFNNIKSAYQAATHENTAVELTAARHDNINNINYDDIGERFDAHSSQLADNQTQINSLNTNVSNNTSIITTHTSQIQALASGSPKGTYTTVSALTTAFPTGNNNTYVVTADGGWYYWNGTAWTKGGTYQAPLSVSLTTGSSDTQVMSQKATTNELLKNSLNIKEITRRSTNLFNANTSINNTAMNSDGSLFTVSGYYVSDIFKLNGKNISGNWLSSATTPHLSIYDKDFNFLRTVVAANQTYVYQSGDYYARAGFRTSATDVSHAKINYGDSLLSYTPYVERSYNNPNIIFVGAFGCDYKTPQEAIDSIIDDSANNRYVIIVMPGVYPRFSMRYELDKVTARTIARYISIIGYDRTGTIISSNTGTYETPPAEIFTNGTIENITFEMKTSSATYTGQGAQLQAYAVHQDFGVCETLYKNCVMYSNAGPAGGFGTYQDGKLRFIECVFTCESDNTYGTNTLGAMFIHTNSMTPDVNQYAEFKNCNAINTYGQDGFRLRIPTGAGGTYKILVQHCGSFGVNGGSAFVNLGILDSKSFGNNVASLNA